MRVCRICGKGDFKEVISFGEAPLVNSLIEKTDLDKKEPTWPLVVEQCQSCFLVQIVEPVSAEKIYRDVDYLYFSGDMPGLKDYFREYAEDVRTRFLHERHFVLEIGSNDGTMLDCFRPAQRVLGVDPASNTVVRALKNGIPTLSDFFSERIAKSIKRDFGQANVIYGNNCIAHSSDLHDLMKGVKTLLAENAVFIVECNYWGGMVKNKNYSLIYHDHFSYFTLQSWKDIASMYGLRVFDAWVTPAQGGSLRVFLTNGSHGSTDRMRVLESEEEKTKLNSYETAIKYSQDVQREAWRLGALVKKLKKEGAKIAGYGAAAKGFSILQLAGITDEIDYFVDDSPAKQGKYTPITHIPVISRADAETKLPDYFFITAPNYAKVIMEKEKAFKNAGGQFILSDSMIV